MSIHKHLIAAFAGTMAASLMLGSIAEAQERRPLRVIVQKRSYLDAGKVVPVGSLNRYSTQQVISSPVYFNISEFYGEGTLPPRIGSGVNPFRNIF